MISPPCLQSQINLTWHCGVRRRSTECARRALNQSPTSTCSKWTVARGIRTVCAAVCVNLRWTEIPHALSRTTVYTARPIMPSEYQNFLLAVSVILNSAVQEIPCYGNGEIEECTERESQNRGEDWRILAVKLIWNKDRTYSAGKSQLFLRIRTNCLVF